MSELFAVENIDQNPWQPRTTEDPEHIEKIGRSIAADDLMQPPVVRKVEGGRAQLAFGHTRHKAFLWLRENYAAQELTDRYEGYTVIPVEVRELTDEAMFRQAVSENISRKDLNAVEEAAAMKRAMDDFHYTSVQVGALFGKSDATVRGTIRLLELPEEAQGYLGRGEISQGAARALLSMQRVAPKQMVVGAVQAIIAREDRETPEVVIRSIIDRMPGTIRLWDDTTNGGRPHAGIGDTWPLDLKKFPNEHLRAIQPNDLISALGITDKRLLDDIKAANGFGENGMSFLYQKWQISELDGDQELAAKLQVLLYPPACTACPAYTKIGGAHFCGLAACYRRKQHAWAVKGQEERKKQLEKTAYTNDALAPKNDVVEAASATSSEDDGEIDADETAETVETVVTAPTAPTASVTAPVPPKPANPLLDDPYKFDECTITVQLTMLPNDGHADGREVMVGVRNHADPFIMGIFRLNELPLPDGIRALLDELQEQLPARELAKAMRAAEANKK